MTRRLLIACSVLAGSWLAAPTSRAQTLDPTFTPPTSLYTPAPIYGMGPAEADGKRVILGSQQRVGGQPTGQLARVTAAGGLDQAFGQNVNPVSNVFRVRAGLNGQYLLGAIGGDVTAGGLTRPEVLRLNADGTADTGFNPGTGPTLAGQLGNGYDYAVQPDGKVLVGGVFDTYSGTLARGLVRLNANGSNDPSFNVGLGIDATNGSDYVQTILVLTGGKLLIGGTFATFNGTTANGLMRLNADGTVDATFLSPLSANAYVGALVGLPDGRVLVSGQNLGSNSSTSTSLIRLLASGARDPSFTFSSAIGYLGGYEEPMAVLPNGQIMVIGTFGSSRVARLNSDGSLDNTLASGALPTDYQTVMGVQPTGEVLLATSSNSNLYGGREGTMAEYNSAGAVVASYNPNPQGPGTVYRTERLSNGDLVVGGSFTEWNGQAVHHLARVSSTGTFSTAFAAATGPLPAPVQQLVVQPDGQLVVGTLRGLARYASTGAPDASFSFFLGTQSIGALAVQPDGKLLVSGATMSSYNYLVRVLPSGARDATFARPASTNSLTSSILQALAVQPDGKILAGGRFGAGTENRTYVVRYEASGANDASFTPALLRNTSGLIPATLSAMTLQADGKILVGGNFPALGQANTSGSVASARVGRLTTTGAPDASFVASSLLTGAAYSLAVQPNGRILVGGYFSFSGGSNLLRLLDNGQTDASFVTTNSPSSTVNTLLVQPDGGIVVGGGFSQIAGQPAVRLARLTAPNVLAVAAPAAVAAATAAWPVPARERLHVLPAPAAHPLAAELLDALGRVVLTRALTSTAEFTLDTQALPAGFYVLRLRYAEGIVARQVAVE